MPINYKLKTAKVVDGDSEIELYGLSLNDITQLVMLNRDAIEAMFQQMSGRNTLNVADAEVRALVMDVIGEAPALVSHAIGLSARALEQFDEIVQWPVGIQIECLMKIGELTFTTEFSPKKALALALKKAGGQSAK